MVHSCLLSSLIGFYRSTIANQSWDVMHYTSIRQFRLEQDLYLRDIEFENKTPNVHCGRKVKIVRFLGEK
jgi:hypothetical protein